MLSFHQLALETETQFAALAGKAWKLESSRVFAETSFRGGFKLEYSSLGRRLTLVYSEMQFEAHADGREVFGHIQHPSFSGNQFSFENFAKYLPQILGDTFNALA
jgi:hypothetical protein